LVVKSTLNFREIIVLRLALCFIASFLCTLDLAHSSGQVLNGGDAVQCGYSDFPPKPGFYSLDYLLTYDPEATPLYEVKSLNESLSRLNAIMKEKLPELHPSFEIFMRNFLNRDMKKTHLWQPAQFGLIDVKDENMIAQLPPMCRVSANKASLIQAVLRQTPAYTRMPSHIVFSFDKNVLKQMDDELPLQLSFLLVHEWLWEYSQHVVTNRMVNRLLHSRDFEKMSRDQILNFFKQISFEYPNDARFVLYPESCEANPVGLQSSFARTRVIGAAAGGLALYCNSEECQSNFTAKWGLFENVFQTLKPKYNFSGDKFEILVGTNNEIVALECQVNFANAEVQCGKLRTRSDFGSGLDEKLSGTMNKSCIRLAIDKTNTTPTGVNRELRVIYLKLDGSTERFR
jgi:hypothetical protein